MAEILPKKGGPMEALSNQGGQWRRLHQGPSPLREIYKLRSDPERRVLGWEINYGTILRGQRENSVWVGHVSWSLRLERNSVGARQWLE